MWKQISQKISYFRPCMVIYLFKVNHMVIWSNQSGSSIASHLSILILTNGKEDTMDTIIKNRKG